MAEAKEKSVFEILNAVDVSKKIEKKNNLSYLSWAWAWTEVKKKFPNANYTIFENEHGWNYHTDGRTCWVKVSVTINDLTHMEYLPIMDYRNNSIPLAKVTSMDVTRAIQRAITKACGRHGCGLFIYAGEDLPEDMTKEETKEEPKKEQKSVICAFCSKPITDKPDWGAKYTAANIVNASIQRYGVAFCGDCYARKVQEEMKKSESEGNAV